MDVNEVKKEKFKLEKVLEKAIQDFEEKTKATVRSVNYSPAPHEWMFTYDGEKEMVQVGLSTLEVEVSL